MQPLRIKLTVGSDSFDLTKADPEKIKLVIDRACELNNKVTEFSGILDEAVKAAKTASKTASKPKEDEIWEDGEDEDEEEDEDEDV